MKINISGKNIELTESLKNVAEDKLGRLEKYFAPETALDLTLSVEKDRQRAEVTIPIKGHVIRAEQVSDDMYVTLDMVTDSIEKQLKKHRTRLASKKLNAAGSFKQEFLTAEADEEESEIRIVKTKSFEMKPMFPEDACLQLELTGHDFYMFRNAQTDEINVVYKRKDKNYGLIEPEA